MAVLRRHEHGLAARRRRGRGTAPAPSHVDRRAGEVGARAHRQPRPWQPRRGATDARGRRHDLAPARRPAARVHAPYESLVRASAAPRESRARRHGHRRRQRCGRLAGAGSRYDDGPWSRRQRVESADRPRPPGRAGHGLTPRRTRGGERLRRAHARRCQPADPVLAAGERHAARNRGAHAAAPTGFVPRRHARPSRARQLVPLPRGTRSARRHGAARGPGAGLPLRAPQGRRERGRGRDLRSARSPDLAATRPCRQRGPPHRIPRATPSAQPVPAELLRPRACGRRLSPCRRSVRPRLRHVRPRAPPAGSRSASG